MRRTDDDGDQYYDSGYCSDQIGERFKYNGGAKENFGALERRLKQSKGGYCNTGRGRPTSNKSYVDKDSLDLDSHHPDNCVNKLMEVKARFQDLQRDHLKTEFELREFILKQREQPMLYVNFLDKFDERDRQILNLVLYKTLENALSETLADQDSQEEIDLNLIEQVKSEMLGTQEELLKLAQESDRFRQLNSSLTEELGELKLIISNLLRFKFNLSEWIEQVIVSFTGLFRMLPGLHEKAEDLYPGLNQQIKSLVMLSENLENLSDTCKENFEDYGPFLSELEAENQILESSLQRIKHSSEFWQHSRYFLLNLGEFLSSHNAKSEENMISLTHLDLQ